MEKMVMGHTPSVTKKHGKVHEMCVGRSVIADVGMSRDYRGELRNATIAVVEMDSEDSATGTVFYEDMKPDILWGGLYATRRSSALLFAPRVVPPEEL